MAVNDLKIAIVGEDKFSGKLKAASNALEDANKKMRDLSIAAGILAAATAGVIAKTIGMAMEQERATQRLTHLTKQTSDASNEQVQALIQQAEALQQLGVVGDEVIMMGQSQLATFALQTSTIETLTPSLLDLAVAVKGVNVTQEDMITLGNLMGKVMTGQTSAMTRYGVVMTDTQEQLLKTGTEMERSAMLAEVMAQNFGGLNEAVRNTTEGQLKALKDSLSDVGEEIGTAFLPLINQVVKSLNPLVIKLKDWVKENQELTRGVLLVTLGITGLIAVIYPLQKIFVLLTGAIAAFKYAILPLAMKGVVMGAVIGGVVALIAWNDELANSLKSKLPSAAGVFIDAISSMRNAMASFISDTVGFFSYIQDQIPAVATAEDLMAIDDLINKNDLAFQKATLDAMLLGEATNDLGTSIGGAGKEVEDFAEKHKKAMDDLISKANEAKATILEIQTAYKLFVTGQASDFGSALVSSQQRVTDLQKQLQTEEDKSKHAEILRQIDEELAAQREAELMMTRTEQEQIELRANMNRQLIQLRSQLRQTDLIEEQAKLENQIQALKNSVEFSRLVEQDYTQFQKDLIKGVENAKITANGTELGNFLTNMSLKWTQETLDYKLKLKTENDKLKAAQEAMASELAEYQKLEAGAIQSINNIRNTHADAMSQMTYNTQKEVAKQQQALNSLSGGGVPLLGVSLGMMIGELGKRASGGSVEAGRPYIVGERQPELFIPNQSGYIHSSVPSGVTINISGVFGSDAANEIGDLIVKRLAFNKAI